VIQAISRDIVVKCLAEPGDPAQTTAGSLAEGKPITVLSAFPAFAVRPVDVYDLPPWRRREFSGYPDVLARNIQVAACATA